MTAPGTRGLFLVAMVGHEVRCGEGLDGGTPLGGVWHVSARSVHAGLPEEKRLGAVVEKRSIALSRANAESLLQCRHLSKTAPVFCWWREMKRGFRNQPQLFRPRVQRSRSSLGICQIRG